MLSRSNFLVLLVLTFALAATGCGKKKKTSLSGTLTGPDGTALSPGYNLLLSYPAEDPNTPPNEILIFVENNGKFQVMDIPLGTAQVYLRQQQPGMRGDINPQELANKIRDGKTAQIALPAIPKVDPKFLSPKTSGWSVEIGEGRNEKNFEAR